MSDARFEDKKPGEPLRGLRRRATAQVVRAAMRISPWLSDGAIDVLERATTAFLPLLARPVLADRVRRNMQAAGVYQRGAEHAYLRQLAAHIASALHIFHGGAADGFTLASAAVSPDSAPTEQRGLEGVLALARRRIGLDDSVEHLRRAAGENRGVILAASHGMQFLLSLARLNEVVPLTVYLRHSRFAHQREAKAAWHRTAGIRIIAEPSKLADPTARAALLAEALAERRVVLITPDVVQRRGRGVPVHFLGREMQMGSGVAALAVLSGAPVVACMSIPQGRRICITLHEPFHAPEVPHRRGWRAEAMRQVQQRWADLFAEHLRRHPHLWYFWADSRWTEVFRDNPKYARRS